MRLNKFIAQNSFLSRRKADEAIESGKVLVNDMVCNSVGTKINPEKDIVTISSNRISSKNKKTEAYVFNKPYGVTCSHKRQKGEKIVKDFFENTGKTKLSICGRLDKNTSGLLILTNDGELANKIAHPSSNIQKEYIVETKEELDHARLKKLSETIILDGTSVTPVSVKKLKPFITTITILEGKNREVRRIFENANLTILKLQRVRIGGFKIGGMEPGTYKKLNEKQIKEITNCCN